MADVLIRCPVTGEPVPTGIGMGWDMFKVVEMNGNVLGNCPQCGQDHRWDKDDAFPDT